MDLDKSKTTLEKVIQINLVNLYFIKLCKIIKKSSFIEGINTCYFSDSFIDTKNCIYQFDRFWILDNLLLMMIRDIYDPIAIKHLCYQKTINLIARNYY